MDFDFNLIPTVPAPTAPEEIERIIEYVYEDAPGGLRPEDAEVFSQTVGSPTPAELWRFLTTRRKDQRLAMDDRKELLMTEKTSESGVKTQTEAEA
ncbi:hypothetical protein HJFPF1_05022 [Paramyrothecium foliicola]|nr:hypothetical protein HJFPF1_05022 [Paramyrothecium foliicola]